MKNPRIFISILLIMMIIVQQYSILQSSKLYSSCNKGREEAIEGWDKSLQTIKDLDGTLSKSTESLKQSLETINTYKEMVDNCQEALNKKIIVPEIRNIEGIKKKDISVKPYVNTDKFYKEYLDKGNKE